MLKKNYFDNHEKYKHPMLIKFYRPQKIKFTEINDFLDFYRPFFCSQVYIYNRFEYGDFDNWVDGISESITISPYSKTIKEDGGIYKAGDVRWSLVSKFWHFDQHTPFWMSAPDSGYNTPTCHSNNIDEIEVFVDGVMIISDSDKRDFELGRNIGALAIEVVQEGPEENKSEDGENEDE